MSARTVFVTGLARALGTHLLGDLAGGTLGRVMDVVKDHLTLDGRELAAAFQDGLSRAATAIALGLSPEGAGVLTRLSLGTRRALAPKIAQVYAQRIEGDYLASYAQGQGLTPPQVQALRAATLALCRDLASRGAEVLPPETLSESDLADLARGSQSQDLAALLLDRAAEALGPLDPQARGLLAHQGLLGDATLWFLRERLRGDERVRATLEALQREGLTDQVAALRASLEGQGGDASPLLGLAETREALAGLLDARLPDLSRELGDLSTQVAAVGAKVDVWGGALQDDLDGLGAHIDHRFAQIFQMLRALGLGIRVTPNDQFVAMGDAERLRILTCQAELARLPRGRGYSLAALAVGSAVSASGAPDGAEALFDLALESAEDAPARALASYNLFQARLRQGPARYPDALQALRQAQDLDPQRHATHEAWKYPIEGILGAGGMGCALLCREPVRRNRQVVVKTFWQTPPGATERIFQEAIAMDEVGRDQAPALLGYGFAPGNGRPYIVMEYLEGYLDGEVWLERYGPLPLAQGMALGRQVLKALAIAHAAGVVHLDLKPANLLLKARDRGLSVKIIDFGLARIAPRTEATRVIAASRRGGLSQLGTSIAGTWDYAAPEQMGEDRYGPPGPRSDLYGLGATWYRLLTGRHPNNRRLKHLPNGCPEVLFELIQDLMEHDPKDRPEGAEAVLNLVSRMPGSRDPKPKPRSASPPPPPPPPQPPPPPGPPGPPDIHGWPTDKVQALQKAAADALAHPVVFRDHEFQARLKERVKTGERERWFSDPEPIYEEREVVKAITPPEMVVVPPGSFLMGSPEGEEGRSSDEGPQHWVTLARPFAIGRYAVTFEEYDAFCAATERDKPGDQGWGRGRQPVIYVSWKDGVAYCQWLSEQTGKPYRLPSEAEWEYAARAGTATPFHFGATLSTAQANYDGNRPYGSGAKGEYRQRTVAVGTLPANPWGLHEVHGNVCEWVQDCWHDSYRGAPVDGSAWQENCQGARRVFRGGSWNGIGGCSRVSDRYWDGAGVRSYFLGLRLAQDL